SEIPSAMLAITHSRALPTVDENPVHAITPHDLAFYLGHELEIVRAEAASDPHFRGSPVPASGSGGIHRDPVGMGRFDIIVGCMRIGPHNHNHTELAAAGDQLPQNIPVAQPTAAMMKWYFRWIIGDTAAAAQAHRIGSHAPEVIEPERQVKAS